MVFKPTVAALLLLASVDVAHAEAVKAQVLCGVVVGDKVETVVPTPDQRKLDKPITCAIHLTAGTGTADLNAKISTDAPDALTHGGPIGKTVDFSTQLAPADDYQPCASFTVTARVFSADRKVWESKIAVKQVCPAAPAATKPAPPATKPTPAASAEPGTEWATGELAHVPTDARAAINTWITQYVFLDGGFFAAFPAGGVTVGKRLITRSTVRALSDKAGGPYMLTKIMPMFACKAAEDAMKNPENCEWAKWYALAKSKTEVWVYNTDGSFYGPFPSAVFKKQAGKWVWTAVTELDQGEP
ncbi:MAG: hypothetical protein NT062_09625 [Proteobacteria bacterium]|nr:hypothetical protein [Pseudomonadota bacterium]